MRKQNFILTLSKQKTLQMDNELFTVQVSGVVESEKSIGALVELEFNELGDCIAATRLVWFPKSISSLQEFAPKVNHNWKSSFITAPRWFLMKNNINFNADKNEK